MPPYDPNINQYGSSHIYGLTPIGGTGGGGINPIYYSPNGRASHMKQKFNIGDKVYCTYGGSVEKAIVADVLGGDNYLLEHTAGARISTPRGYSPRFCDRYLPVQDHYMTLVDSAKSNSSSSSGSSKKFDLKHLDALIIAKAVRDEIEAVLKQHKHGSKLFEEWGLAETIEYGKGMTFLFYGGPGTGKTWGANCISKVVGQELLVIGAAEIQSSEPGAANRNIQDAFKNAKDQNKILFLDECDSLITSRNDVGMVLGGEINTLLTEIEKTEGIVILTTNRIENLDEALERRISLIVEFPDPDYDQRVAIFSKLMPKKMPVGKGVTAEVLGEFKLTGGQIKNVVLQAARLAISGDNKEVKLEHFHSAVERVHKSKNLMGTASRYRQATIKEDFKRVRG